MISLYATHKMVIEEKFQNLISGNVGSEESESSNDIILVDCTLMQVQESSLSSDASCQCCSQIVHRPYKTEYS